MPATSVTVDAPPGPGGEQVSDPMATACTDPSIQPCPPCCPDTFQLDTALLQVAPVPVSTFVPRPDPAVSDEPPSFSVEPTNENGNGGMSATTMLAIGAVLAAGGVAWWLYKS